MGLLKTFIHRGLNKDMNVLNSLPSQLLLIFSFTRSDRQTDELIRVNSNTGYLQNIYAGIKLVIIKMLGKFYYLKIGYFSSFLSFLSSVCRPWQDFNATFF